MKLGMSYDSVVFFYISLYEIVNIRYVDTDETVSGNR